MKNKKALKQRLMLEALCEGEEQYWHEVDGQRVVNVYALSFAIERWAAQAQGRKTVSQSTLARNYNGFTKNFSPETASALSEFFRVPKAVITGDLEITHEGWGMNITIPEVRWVMLIRELSQDQRNAIYASIRAMLPPGVTPPPLPPGATPILRLPKH